MDTLNERHIGERSVESANLLSFTVFIVCLQFAIFKKGVEEEEVGKK